MRCRSCRALAGVRRSPSKATVAGFRPDQPIEDAKQRRLAAAAGAEQHRGAARRDAERDAIQHAVRAERFADAARFEHAHFVRIVRRMRGRCSQLRTHSTASGVASAVSLHQQCACPPRSGATQPRSPRVRRLAARRFDAELRKTSASQLRLHTPMATPSEASLMVPHLPRLAPRRARVRPAVRARTTSPSTITRRSRPSREMAVSPDGKHVAYCEARWDKADDRRRPICGSSPPMARASRSSSPSDRANDRHPKWSHDGKAIYVLGNRKSVKPTARRRCGRSPLDGGEPASGHQGGGRRHRLRLRPEDRHGLLHASTPRRPTRTSSARCARSSQAGIRPRQAATVCEVYRLDLQSWRAGEGHRREALHPRVRGHADGKRIAMISAFDDSVLKSEGESRVDMWEGGKVVTPPTDVYRAKAASPYAWLESLAWNPDGTRLRLLRDLRRLSGRGHHRQRARTGSGRRRG